ncbi:sensor histidine kinase [Lysinibacillus agricola]|uniref:histidine kinase n=1 Tax=Lysinibacillus agricola TaxID=2590012 RepID=A0ABX7ASK4_9BACI|nr:MULTISPECIES: sensor histidine kinase [Lysinibacillus]KOS60511.1 histidine kinase [Lysinibacillus sp. FJAT-14222]QQP12760.1 sensor histidine kinase [Lysinibacillus agricola]
MIIFLLFIIVLLLGIIIFQVKTKKQQNVTIQYMHQKLQAIINEQSSEKILASTANQELQQLLNAMNALLDHNQKILATHRKMESSMKKMLANISHDLKTPLTVVLGYTEMLQLKQSLSEEERQRLLTGVHSKTLEVLKIIHTFFDLAKLEAGDTDYPMTKINVSEICRKNILSFYDMVTSMGLEIDITIPEISVYALGNEEALDRVLNNLLSNAIAYGAAGNIIGLTVRNDDTNIFIDVWDRGKGIDEYQIDNVFERMYTLEDSRNKTFQGSGLGLTITKRLVELMNGSIQLSSIPYEKTIFTVSLKRMMY